MDNTKYSYAERLGRWLAGAFAAYRGPFISGLAVGLAAHMFMFANKLVNHDDIEALFFKGATVTSGRWGLELSRLLFPNISMPWIYGLVTLLLITASACLILNVLDIRSGLMRLLLPAAVVSFPSLTGTFCFMFTSSAYGLAFLLSVLCVYMYKKGGAANAVLAVFSLLLCLSIYQAYIAISASLFILLMMKRCLRPGEPWRGIVLFGLKALGMMLVSLLLYFAVTLLVFRLTGAEFNSYVIDNVNSGAGIPGKIRMAYESFRDVFTIRNYSLISSEASGCVHMAMAAFICLGLLLASAGRGLMERLLLAALLLLLPLSINCMYLMMSPQSIHTLVLYSFVCFYFLAGITLEALGGVWLRAAKDLLALALGIVIASNVYFANMTYLKLHLQYESASSFYISMIAQIKDTEGFDENSRLAIIGSQDNLLYYAPELDTHMLLGPSYDLINIYSRESLFRQYLGFDLPFATAEEAERISAMPEFEQMAEYPYNGSVKKIENYIVVKLG